MAVIALAHNRRAKTFEGGEAAPDFTLRGLREDYKLS